MSSMTSTQSPICINTNDKRISEVGSLQRADVCRHESTIPAAEGLMFPSCHSFFTPLSCQLHEASVSRFIFKSRIIMREVWLTWTPYSPRSSPWPLLFCTICGGCGIRGLSPGLADSGGLLAQHAEGYDIGCRGNAVGAYLRVAHDEGLL